MIDTIYIPVVHLSEAVKAFVEGIEDKNLNERLKAERENHAKLNNLLNHGGAVILSAVMSIDLQEYYVFKVHTVDPGEEDA